MLVPITLLLSIHESDKRSHLSVGETVLELAASHVHRFPKPHRSLWLLLGCLPDGRKGHSVRVMYGNESFWRATYAYFRTIMAEILNTILHNWIQVPHEQYRNFPLPTILKKLT